MAEIRKLTEEEILKIDEANKAEAKTIEKMLSFGEILDDMIKELSKCQSPLITQQTKYKLDKSLEILKLLKNKNYLSRRNISKHQIKEGF
jgi:hypothetical protein